jgi:cytoskeletal protein CcmA (bactofilin family)
MFTKEEKDEFAVPTTNSGEVMGFIGKGMTIDGKMGFDGVVRVDGSFKGEISSTGTLHVGAGAVVEAEVNVDTAVVSGEVKGEVNAKTRVELKAPGKVFGDIKTPTLIVSEGVIFEGNCVMTKKDKVEKERPVKDKPEKGKGVELSKDLTGGVLEQDTY